MPDSNVKPPLGIFQERFDIKKGLSRGLASHLNDPATWWTTGNFRFYKNNIFSFYRKKLYSAFSATAQTLTIPEPVCRVKSSSAPLPYLTLSFSRIFSSTIPFEVSLDGASAIPVVVLSSYRFSRSMVLTSNSGGPVSINQGSEFSLTATGDVVVDPSSSNVVVVSAVSGGGGYNLGTIAPNNVGLGGLLRQYLIGSTTGNTTPMTVTQAGSVAETLTNGTSTSGEWALNVFSGTINYVATMTININ